MAVAVVTRRRGVRAIVVVAAAFPLLLAGGRGAADGHDWRHVLGQRGRRRPFADGDP